MGTKPKWLENADKNDHTRKRSGKQEKKLSKQFKGRTTINSGATFRQNDVMSDTHDIEAKTTRSSQFVLKESDLEKMAQRVTGGRTPAYIVQFEKSGKSYVIVELQEYLDRIEL
jgi:hypothetical protein